REARTIFRYTRFEHPERHVCEQRAPRVQSESIESCQPLDRPRIVNRRSFLRRAGLGATGLVVSPLVARAMGGGNGAYEFVFARLRYDSGDWDYNPKVCANVLDAVLQYTEIPVHQQEVVITLDSAELSSFPFLFMTGHKLVRFSERERAGLVRYVENGGLLFSDDCNHDVNGLYAKSFEAEIKRAFPGAD